MKQLNLAMTQYRQDYDDHFPIGLNGDDAGYAQSSLDIIQPYLKNFQVAICPADSGDPDIDMKTFTVPAPGKGLSSYAANDKICTVDVPPPSEAEVHQPSRIPLLWDAYIANVIDYQPYIEVQRRHLEGANCAFVDGHVKWYKTHPELSDPIPGKEDAYWNTPPDDDRP